MNQNDERNLTLIETTKTETTVEPTTKKVRQSNPITKKFLEFHNDKVEKFTVKDLFRK